jgi:hypothetical protein
MFNLIHTHCLFSELYIARASFEALEAYLGHDQEAQDEAMEISE